MKNYENYEKNFDFYLKLSNGNKAVYITFSEVP